MPTEFETRLKLAENLYQIYTRPPDGLVKFEEFYSKRENKESIELLKKNVFGLTEYELTKASPGLREFVLKYNFRLDPLKEYGMTPPLEEFNDNFNKLAKHISFTDEALITFNEIVEQNYENYYDELGYGSSEDGFNDFNEDWKKSYNIFYEQCLITLLAIFESFMSHGLKFVYRIDSEASKNLKLNNLTYGDILNNFENLLDTIIDDNIDRIFSWEQRNKAFSKRPPGINWESREEAATIKEAIARRNIIIHNKGEIDQRYLNIVNNGNLKLGDKIHTSKNYYSEVAKAVTSLAKFIDEKIKEKYFPSQNR